jgi:hypothetical protein
MSIKEQENNIRTLLQKNVHQIINNNDDNFNDFLNIMKNQEQWEGKLNNILSFKVTRSRLNKALMLQVKVKNMNKYLTVSWRKGSTKKRKEENPLQSAFRQSVRTQIKQWRKFNGYNPKCVHCEKLSKRLQVDHKEPTFIDLTKSFLELEINKNPPTSFDYHYKVGKKFKKEDNRFKIRWQNYHQKNATLQWLCQSCNLKKNKK